MRVTEFRSIAPEAVKIVDEKAHRIQADVTPYGVLDTYQTRFRPGVWTRSLEVWPPPMAWSHQWTEPIGRLVDFEDNEHRLRTVHELDDFDAVPRAKQAYAQLKSGTLHNFSFGFSRSEQSDPEEDGSRWIEQGELDEVSPVLRGSVPGAQLVGVRGVQAIEVLHLARQLEAGEIDLEAALAVLDSAETRARHYHAKQDGSGPPVGHSHSDDLGMHAHSGLMPVMNKRDAEPEPTRAIEPAAGVAANITCPECSAENEPDAKYCDQCGARLLAAAGRDTELLTEARALLATLKET